MHSSFVNICTIHKEPLQDTEPEMDSSAILSKMKLQSAKKWGLWIYHKELTLELRERERAKKGNYDLMGIGES